MKAIILASAAVIATAAAPSSASILTIGGSYARACYDAAEARNSSPESVENCDMAFAIQPLDADDIVATHVNRGIIHMIRGDHVRARADFDTALALNPQQPEAWLNKGILIFDEGDSRAASSSPRRRLPSTRGVPRSRCTFALWPTRTRGT